MNVIFIYSLKTLELDPLEHDERGKDDAVANEEHQWLHPIAIPIKPVLYLNQFGVYSKRLSLLSYSFLTDDCNIFLCPI